MKLGDVLRKERESRKITVEDAASKLGLSREAYQELESGSSTVEEWGPKLAQLAIKLSTSTSRLISEAGKSAQAGQNEGQCGLLIKSHRERREMSQEQLAERLDWHVNQLALIESGESALEWCAPVLLRFAEMIQQPIFNLFYPCGLPFADLNDYP